MIDPVELDKFLREKLNVGMYAGVPDSLLKHFCNYLYSTYGIGPQNMICVNEGSGIAYSAGAYLASGKIPCVFMQNSGLGNAVNPLLSLVSPRVYRIPLVLIIGWRGEPGEKDEPQHHAQGEVTEQLLELLQIPHVIIDKNSTMPEIIGLTRGFSGILNQEKAVAFLVKKNAFTAHEKPHSASQNTLIRETFLYKIAERYPHDLFIATTGVTSRELFEVRERLGQSHTHDFLTVGSMGHASAIALGAAQSMENKTAIRIWCLDGDGALLMHMGAMAMIGSSGVKNFVHVLLNNEAHESVGGLPTAGGMVDFLRIAEGCGYEIALRVSKMEDLSSVFSAIESARRLAFIEVKIRTGTRPELGRPTISPEDGKNAFRKEILLSQKSL
jgi:phosphonopyruvate decarboxylase